MRTPRAVRREQLRAERGPLKLYDRGERFYELLEQGRDYVDNG